MYGPEANDLVLQLRKNRVDQVILAGMSANLCVEAHLRETGSPLAERILEGWSRELERFVQICPKEMLDKLDQPLSDAEKGGKKRA